MSELKVYRFLGQDEVWPAANLGSDYYLKSEADKVIKKLNEKLDLYKRGWAENDKVNAYLYAELRHQKYKRCLATANYWGLVSVFTSREIQLKCMHRELQWYTLAEKFKEANDGND